MDGTTLGILLMALGAIVLAPTILRWVAAQRAAQKLKAEERQRREQEQRIKEQGQRDGGELGEKRLTEVLQQLKGTTIAGYIATKNLYIPTVGNFEMDAVVLMPNVGLVVLEAKNYAGVLTASASRTWHQDKRGEIRTPANACLQALRQATFLGELLARRSLNRWPIHAMVVIANRSTVVRVAPAPNAPQTPVVRLDELKEQLQKLPKAAASFRREDFDALQQAFQLYEREFAA